MDISSKHIDHDTLGPSRSVKVMRVEIEPKIHVGASVELRRRGWTLQEIADVFGVTREAIRSAIEDLVDPQEAREQRRKLREEKLNNLVPAARLLRVHARVSYKEMSGLLDLSAEETAWVMQQIPIDERNAGHPSGDTTYRYTDADIVVAVRQSRAKNPKEYEEWRKGRKAPSVPLIHNRMGWGEAKRRAGLPTRAQYKTRSDRIPMKKVLADLTLARDILGRAPSHTEYTMIAKQEGLTSPATVRKRINGWRNVLAAIDGTLTTGPEVTPGDAVKFDPLPEDVVVDTDDLLADPKRQRRIPEGETEDSVAKKGDRVRLVACNDPYTRIKYGTEGTVTLVDSTGTVFVNWDDGSTLGMVADAGDRFEVIATPA